MVDPKSHILSFCSGVGMLDEGVCIALPGARVVGYVERDAYAAADLMARMEDEALEPVPLWCGNLEDFDAAAWVGSVDGITAGFPCPPVSNAGSRKGIEDERWIFPEIMRLVRQIKPRWIFLENVGGLRTANAGREFGEVLRLISESGFDAGWLTLPASDVGAPHERERVFILAYRNSEGCGFSGQPVESGLSSGDEPEQGHPELADPECGTGSAEHQLEHSEWTELAGGSSGKVADAEREGPQGPGSENTSGWGELEPFRGERREDSPFPPGPRDLDSWGRIVEDGSADYRAPSIKPGLRVLADGMAMVVDASRADQLRCAGNGVVALQAAVAFTILDRRVNLNE